MEIMPYLLGNVFDPPASRAAGYSPYSILESHYRRNTNFKTIITSSKGKPQKLPLPGPSHGTLGFIHLQFKVLTQEPGDTSQYPMTSTFASDINITIIRIAHEPVSPSLQLTIQSVEQKIC